MKHTLRSFALALVLTACSMAGPILTLDPSAGNLLGSPGATVGWGFRISADSSEWISFVTSFLLFETEPGIGVYEDLIGPKGGPVDRVLSPGSSDWVESFDLSQGLGLGAFEVAPFAPLGTVNRAQLIVFYERFSDDPSLCPDCFLGSGELQANVGVTVGEIPEPGTWSLVVAAAIGLWLRSRRQRCV